MYINFKLSFTFFKPQVRQKGRDKSHVRQTKANITQKGFEFSPQQKFSEKRM